MPELSYREGGQSDLEASFDLSQRAMHEAARRQRLTSRDLGDEEIADHWSRHRTLVEFLTAQQDARFWLCEEGDELVGFARVVRFGDMEELNELMVHSEYQHRGIGRSLLERCWPGDPSPEMGRACVALGTPDNLSLYTEFGVMPIAGHWHLLQPTKQYEEQRSLEIDSTDPGVSMLKGDRAAAEWKRLEPAALGYDRSALHDFFGRDRVCLASMDLEAGHARALCWVSSRGEIGPAVGTTTEDLVPVVLAALDRVARTQEPENLRVFCTTTSWWLLRRLRGLGFQVFWPAWIMSSVPIPGLDRYTPAMPPQLL
ncbi:MAG: GNAT family N-acetyltransferase [Thermoleophilaceae bacterium]